MAITANKELRTKIRRGGLFYWMVARELDVTEGTLIRWLRTELEGDRKKEVNDAVVRLYERMRRHEKEE